MKKKTLKESIKIHKLIAWLGGVALLIFISSALTHPLMVWTGPQPKAFFPPQAKFAVSNVAAISGILRKHKITQASMVKLVPSADKPLLQVTENALAPRRYFELATGAELLNFDSEYAKWLGEYYTGLGAANIDSIELQTSFNNEYPWVNRLLPVYRISYNTPDHKVAFIYTELAAIASLSNDWKTSLQTVFTTLHTFSWLEQTGAARVLVMLVFLGAIFAMTITGIAMVFFMKKRKIVDKKRRLHRAIACIVWLPILAFTISGTYHLLKSELTQNQQGLKLPAPTALALDGFGTDFSGFAKYETSNLNAISLVKDSAGNLLFRLGIPSEKPQKTIQHNQRYDGVATEKQAVYFDAKTGQESTMNDKQIAQYYAGIYSHLAPEKIAKTELISSFSADYDFRNKRLPVWKISYNSKARDVLFIDPANGVLVDRATTPDIYENLSFSMLHKWNFLVPLIGRELRDALAVGVLLASLTLVFFGFAMLLRRKK